MIHSFNSKIIFTILFASTFLVSAFAKTNPVGGTKLLKDFREQNSQSIAFTENKGQVHDQNYSPRPDVLYGAITGNMAVHIKKTGVSYQLYRVDSYKEVEDPKTIQKRQEIDEQTIYRIDLNWLNHNSNFTTTKDATLPGYTNYYLENCPNGVLKINSYKGITVNNLYNGIDLHYYEKNGELKYDYIVAPHADYKLIQLQIEGAEISINKDGSLILTTPLGKVQEGAPIVFQNGKQLKAKWIISHAEHGKNPFGSLSEVAGSSSVSFEIENYNPNYELIIDPLTRLWGTYYGGMGFDYGYSCTTDASGNVYMTGIAGASTGTIIATVGSHQSTFGGNNSDAFIVKFNTNGIRQWSTYYGGSGGDVGYSCATDVSGNVFMTGLTNSNIGTAIATAGSHQSAYGGGQDAFLVKFNANGIRQWGTYYGGSGVENGSSCATDPSGNIYITGYTGSNAGAVIATAGSNQSVYGTGTSDAFLVKFNTNGIRQWGTYLGGSGLDNGNSCATDASGNVFMAGNTSSNAGNVISTGGCYQPNFAGGHDAFLVKFNASGVRQWGTFYGGSGTEIGNSCAADASGNVYMTGRTDLNTSTVIATAGCHQPTSGGGNDAFLVKFDANGIRQWGTYYGGTGVEEGNSCVTDVNNNVYIVGLTDSNTGTIIVTAGSYQSVFGGGSGDAFLVKFDTKGIRQWGTYYGASGSENGTSCTTDVSGNSYVAGYTNSNTSASIAWTNGHQSIYGGGSDCFLVKFDVCNAPAQSSSIIGETSICSASGMSNYSVASVADATSYTWSLPSGWSGSSSTNIILTTLGSSGVFTVTANNACGISPQQTLQVVVKASPTIIASSNSTLLCVGKNATLTATGAATYTFNPGGLGSSIVISPNITTTYTILGTNANGCSNTATIIQNVDECTGIKNEELNSDNYRDNNSGVFIFPNPTNGIVNMELEMDNKVTIVNSKGQTVYSSALNAGKHQVNFEGLAKGIYLLNVNNSQSSKNIKIIKE